MDATYFLLLSSLGLVITTQAQNCTRPAGGENMNLKDNYILLDTFPDGAKVSFACEVGYMAAGGSPSITCTAGSWSPLRLKCERRNCGPAEEVLNGHVDYSQGTEFGDELVVICNEGFRLVGRTNKRLCGAQGWMGKMPECEAVTCDPPPPVQSGTFRPDNDIYQYGEVVEYSCQKDYTLSGPKTVTCSANGGFNPAPPTCINVQCKEPVIANAEWIGGSRPPYRYQSTVTYRCRSGYTMTGESTLTCGVDGQWSPELPTCEQVQCKEPVIANADWIGGSRPPHTYQSMVTYRCRSGFTMIGQSTLTCGVDGQWSPELPTCEQVQCKEPVIANADWIGGSRPPHTYQSMVTYRCRSGFTMIGQSTLTCGVDGQWSPELPTCEQVQCKEPVIANADWIGGSRPPHTYQSMVTYRCRSGFTMIGQSTLTCGVDGQWSPGLPTCEQVQCKEPFIANADWIGGSRPPHTYQSMVTYRCRSGFTMIGQSTLTCGVDGQWSPELPTCEQVQCKEPVIANASRTGGEPPYGYQSLVTYTCKSGYKMIGQPTLTCGTNGQWSPELPKCQADSKTTVPPSNSGKSLALGLGIGLPVCIIALFLCGCYFCGFPCIKTKRGSRSSIPGNVVPKDGEDVAL